MRFLVIMIYSTSIIALYYNCLISLLLSGWGECSSPVTVNKISSTDGLAFVRLFSVTWNGTCLVYATDSTIHLLACLYEIHYNVIKCSWWFHAAFPLLHSPAADLSSSCRLPLVISISQEFATAFIYQTTNSSTSTYRHQLQLQLLHYNFCHEELQGYRRSSLGEWNKKIQKEAFGVNKGCKHV